MLFCGNEMTDANERHLMFGKASAVIGGHFWGFGNGITLASHRGNETNSAFPHFLLARMNQANQ